VNEFEKLLQENMIALKRYINFKINNRHDAEDILQDVCLTATLKFESLNNVSAFKAWLIGIAAHKCNDYYRKRAREYNVPLDVLPETALSFGRVGVTPQSAVRDALDALAEKEKQLLNMYFFQNMSQEEISRKLSIPVGTVKSRLHYAKKKFKQHYPTNEKPKGDAIMKWLPEYLPEYKIEKSSLAPFSVKCEELMGICIIPKLNEKITWASYDMPSRKMNDLTEAAVIQKAEVHGIEGVEISTKQYDCQSKKTTVVDFIAQLTDTHCRYLAESHIKNGFRKCFTFLDGEVFMNNWGFGDDNSGYETHILPRGVIRRDGNNIEVTGEKEVVDIVGRYTVTINNKVYDTVCVMDIGHFGNRIAIEQYLDENGCTVLWRRFNRNDWAQDRYKKPWTELLSDNETISVNGETYVHWYDCVTEYIF